MNQAGKDEISNVQIKVAKGVSSQIEEFKKDISNKFDAEFADEKIQKRISDRLSKMTDAQLRELIEGISGDQAKAEAMKLKPELRQIIKDDANLVLAELKPTIEDAVGSAINTQVEDSVAPVRKSVKELNVNVKFQRALANLSSVDQNRVAFDYILRVANGDEPESRYRTLQESAKETIAAWKSGLRPDALGEVFQNDTATLKRIISEKSNMLNIGKRSIAIDNYPDSDKTILPTLVEIVKNEQSFGVVLTAIRKINKMSGKNFDYLDKDELFHWWRTESENGR